MMAVTTWPAGQAGPMEPELASGSAVKRAEVGRGQLVRDYKRSQTTTLDDSKLFLFLFFWGCDNAFNSRGRGESKHWGQAAVCLPKVPPETEGWELQRPRTQHSMSSHFSLSFHIFRRLSLRKKYCSSHLGRRHLQPGPPGPWLSGLEGATLLEE